ncbi:MAG: hypothetical protein JO256_00400, partial [Alphaproteobacteria bacterium]|nr:hypothetical protein [Alphaproteobacteria bacterium]
ATARGFSAARDHSQLVRIFVNEAQCGTLQLRTQMQTSRATCPPAALRKGDNMVRLHIAAPARPADLGEDDNRRLGMELRSLSVLPAGTP